MTLLGTITFILLGLIFGAGIGWLFGKWKIHRMMKKIDKQVNLPETIQKVNEMAMEQKLAQMKREVRDDERRRNEFRGYGDGGLNPINTGTGESGTQRQGKRYDAPAGSVYRGKLQNENVRDSGPDNGRNEEPKRNIKEDWADFS